MSNIKRHQVSASLPAAEDMDSSDSGSAPLQLQEKKEELVVKEDSNQTNDLQEGAKTADVTNKPYEYVKSFKLGIVVTSVTLVAFLVMLDTAIIATAIPRITSDFHSLADVGWYGSAYLLASCSLQPLTGRIYTYFSSKYTFLAFLAIFELGSLLCGVASSSDMLIVGRAIAGLGSSGLMNGSLTIVAACIPLDKRPLYIGVMMSVSQIGIVLGPLLGGALTQYATWRWCFYINLPAGGAVAILLLLIHIPDRIQKTALNSTLCTAFKKLDLIGFLLFAPAAIQFLLALEWGGNRLPWNSATIVGLFCGAFGVFFVFLWWENHIGDAAMIPLSIFRYKIVCFSCLVVFFYFGTMLTTSYYLPIYFQAVKGVTPTLSGVYVLPMILSQMLFAIVSGVLVGRIGYYLPWGIASSILMAIGTGLFSTFTKSTSTATWVGYEIIVGAGRGCGLQMPIVAIQNALPDDLVAVGMSLSIFSQTLGGAIFLSLAQTVFTHGLIEALTTFAPEVSPETIINAGASAIGTAVPQASLIGVLFAYNQAVSYIFYLGAGAAVASFTFCWGMGWKSVKKVNESTPED